MPAAFIIDRGARRQGKAIRQDSAFNYLEPFPKPLQYEYPRFSRWGYLTPRHQAVAQTEF
jgi:hypothetical protein